ncbi:MAG: phosphotransferase family protein [Paracoccaceae bacterium]
MTATSMDIDALRRSASDENASFGAAKRPGFASAARNAPRSAAGALLMQTVLARLGNSWAPTKYHTQNRRTLCAVVSDGNTNAVVKIRLETDGKHGMAKEHAALSRAYAGSDRGIPRPLHFFPDLHAMVISEIPGVSLEYAVKRRWKSRAEVIGEVGSALSQFHDRTGRIEKVAAQLWHEKTVPPAIRAACETKAEHAWADRVLEAYLAAAERTRDDMVPFGFTHEDLVPRNVLVSGFDIGFIDFENSQETHCLNDLAQLALGVQMLRGTPGRWRRHDRLGLGFSAVVLDTLCDGYGLLPSHQTHFATLLLRASLQCWHRAKQRGQNEQPYRQIQTASLRLADRIARALNYAGPMDCVGGTVRSTMPASSGWAG